MKIFFFIFSKLYLSEMNIFAIKNIQSKNRLQLECIGENFRILVNQKNIHILPTREKDAFPRKL